MSDDPPHFKAINIPASNCAHLWSVRLSHETVIVMCGNCGKTIYYDRRK